MKRASYQNTRYNSQDYQYSDSEEQQSGYRYKSMEKRSRHVPGSVPNSTSDHEFSRYERYESHQTSILEKDQSSIARKVIFYKNSDSLFQGIPLAVSRKKFPEFPSLLAELNSKIPLPNGVRFIFRLEDGKKIESLDEIQGGEEYVVSSKSKFDRRTNYGAPSPTKPRSNMQRSQGPSREHLLNNRNNNYQSAYGSPKQNHHLPQVNNKPLKFTVINNTYRSLRDKMILNPNTEQSFEELLANMGEVVSIIDGPPTAIFRAKSPYTEITCFSALKTELTHKNEDKRCDEFFICDDKGPPKEMIQRARNSNARSSNVAPSDTSYDDATEEDRKMGSENNPDRRQKPKERGRQPPQTDRYRQQKPSQRDPRYENMNGTHVSKNGSMNGTKEHTNRGTDERKFTKAPQTYREEPPTPREQDPPPKRYTSPPRNINKQNEQRHPRQSERQNLRQSQNTPRRPDPTPAQNRKGRENPNHREEQVNERRGTHDTRNAHNPRNDIQHNKMADEMEHDQEPRGSYHGEQNGVMENGVNMDDDRGSYKDNGDGREEEEMDHDDRENGDENEDDYDDDSDGPGEPRAARKGPRMETPEF